MARRTKSLKKYVLLAFLISTSLLVAYVYWPDTGSKNTNSRPEQPTTTSKSKVKDSSFPVINLQPVVDAWAAKQSGTASVVIYDLANKQTVASLNPNRQYFTASIYKLYVAYIGYQKIADGTFSAKEQYLYSYTRDKCLDLMIRESYSPCGEKMWSELGKDTLTTKLKAYGLTNTSMTSLYTSAKDAALILQRLFERRDLTEAHTKLFLDSLEDQPHIYRRGLPSGFAKSTVYNKVGWNELIEWHDTAIITLPNGRSYVITVLTKNVGSYQIAALGRSIEARLTK